MDFRCSDEETAFLKEVRQFIKESTAEGWLGVDPGPEEEADDEVYRMSLRNWRRLGEKHWIGLTWPKAYGGQEAPLMKEMVMLQELAHSGCPGIDVGIVEADLILQFGTEEQKKRFIPPILRGEVKWAIGMSEPNAGLRHLQRAAERCGTGGRQLYTERTEDMVQRSSPCPAGGGVCPDRTGEAQGRQRLPGRPRESRHQHPPDSADDRASGVL